ncbi:hypothetical protein Pint_29195 [Pistacia integerrima]|uniref:Uncharacterized protein n=1 Tax=Pistacia integerrima TaxID=434235 RepID=A0ACC0X228_9ROSI|nr:hypothetical protein Pint_29195 [Pistacia integerrima]
MVRVIEDPKGKKKGEERAVSDNSKQGKQKKAGMSDHTQQGANVAGEENHSVSLEEPSPSNILALGYHGLPYPLSPCLIYLCLFPRSYEIPIRRLFLLCIFQGLMKPLAESCLNLEDLAESCLKELRDRNLIEVVSWRLDGSPKTCFVPSTLYDSIPLIATRMGYFHVHFISDSTSKPPNFTIRRLVEYSDIEKNSFSGKEIQHLCSYISFNNEKKEPSRAVGKFLNKITTRGFGFLTVLDLEGVYKPALPETLGRKLLLLRYVGLRRTFLNSIPESVCDIWYLEALDVKYTLITTLPMSIWKAYNLRHLYMHGIFLEIAINDDEFPIHLKTLWGVVIGDSRRTVNWLTRLRVFAVEISG